MTLAVDLLRGVKDQLQSAPAAGATADVRQRAYSILRQEGLYHWARQDLVRKDLATKLGAIFGIATVGSADIPRLQRFLDNQVGGRRDAALDELYTAYNRPRPTGEERARIVGALGDLWREAWGDLALTHEIEGNRGPHRIGLEWLPDDARFAVRVEETGDGAAPGQFEIMGEVRLSVADMGDDVLVAVKPLANPFRLLSGEVAVGPAADSGRDAEIAKKRQEIEDLEADKAHIWKNPETGETVRQERFKRLDEPFEYEGEGYADPEAELKRQRLKSEIATLEGRPEQNEQEPPNDASDAEPVATGSPQPEREAVAAESRAEPGSGRSVTSGRQGNAIISLDGDLFPDDEPIDVAYQVPEKGAFKMRVYSLQHPAKDWTDRSYRYGTGRNLEFGESPIQLWPRAELRTEPGPFFDVRIEVSDALTRRRFEPQYLRVVPQDRALPNAIKIVGGPRHSLGAKVIAEVNLPDSYTAGLAERVKGKFRERYFTLSIVRMARGLRGGSVVPAYEHARFELSEGLNQIDIATKDEIYYRLGPGQFELLLLRDGVVIDQAPLLITVDQLPGSLSLVGDAQPNAGTPFSVTFDAPRQTHHEFAYALEFFSVGEHGRPRDNFNRTQQGFLDVEPGVPVSLHPFGVGGNHVVRLLLKPGYLKAWYVLDSLELKIRSGDASRGEFHFAVDGVSQFDSQGLKIDQGRDIPIELSLRGLFASIYGSKVTPRLYRLAAGSERLPSVVQPGTPIGELIREWPAAAVEPTQAWLIDEKLDVGRYAVGLELELWKQIQVYQFEIIPGFAGVQLSLGDKRRFRIGEEIDVALNMPDDYPAANQTFELYISRMGGHVPGCAVEYFPKGTYLAGKPRTAEASWTVQTWDVGVYVLHLYEKSRTKRKILHEVAIEVVASPLPGSVKVPESAGLHPGDEMTIVVDLTAEHPATVESRFSIGDPSIAIVRHGADTTTGTSLRATRIRPPAGMPDASKVRDAVVSGKGKAEFVVTVPPPGSYEARLYDSRLKYLAHAPFTVGHPDSPFALDYGLESISVRDDVDASDNRWPAHGEYLSGADCEPELQQEEKMDLRFVQLQDGAFVPIEGALNYGDGFYLEGRLEAPALKKVYVAEIGAGANTEQVNLVPEPDNPSVVRSKLLYFVWDSSDDMAADGAR